MGFPDTGVLDDFNRADSATTIGGNWSMFMRSAGSYDMGISSNQAYNPDAEWNGLIYDAAQYGPDCEVYVTMAALCDFDADGVVLYARLKDIVVDAWNYDGYSVFYWPSAGTPNTVLLRVYRVDNSVATQLGASVEENDPANGDKFGIQLRGSVIDGWFQPNGGSWTLKLTRTDATYGAAGYLGFYSGSESTWRMDDFGGGTLGRGLPILSGGAVHSLVFGGVTVR